MPGWTERSIPDQTGRTAIVTGANSGIGAAAAFALAAKGARVVLAVRDPARGEAARRRILARHPGASLEILPLDLADLGSIRRFADGWHDTGRPAIDLLLNNAGLGLLPQRRLTADGFETQFGTNHLGHFALTGLLLPALLRADAPRVVTISSIAHRRGRIDFDDLQRERYNPSATYAQSKLANLMFALTLDRHARAAGTRLVSVAAHPGISATHFFSGASAIKLRPDPKNRLFRLLGVDPARGALPGLYAATMPDVTGGQYWGPDGFAEIRGYPAPAVIRPQARDEAAQERLWQISISLTGVDYAALGG